ncbi:MAG: phage integrase SAM-like domain-containing protein [Bacteroidetes bacterium]|nr:phage integrase SAM-like domain-containing protein [Bacteroidota bacterium]
MKRHTFNILFWLYKSKKNSAGESPIYCRITVNGIQTQLSTHRYIKPLDWNSAKGMVKGRSDEAVEHNKYLEALKQKIRNKETELMKLGRDVTARSIKSSLDGNTVNKKGIVEVADYHQAIIESKLNKGYSQSSISSYTATVKYIKAFIRHHYKCADLSLSEIEYNFILEFEKYVKGHTDCNQNGTMKHIQRLKRIIHFSIENEWLDRSPFMRYKAKYERTNREFLTLDELTKIEQKDFSIPRLQLVKDLFVFACYTGKGYKDMMNLKPENISIRLYGKKWLVGERSKTNVQSDVPLLPKPLEIIERYTPYPIYI